ncbi:MAG TPA: hypothetical protein VFA91_06605 [Candidatus Polarisedimenticolia bacterium]|nr:hypothetical protein [Candidatus Polarisedimenticolia bacterium]
MADRPNPPPPEPANDRGSPFAGDKLHSRYNPYAPENYDSGGFGFGGTSGSAGGFGIGGVGPQTGGYGSQANYGQGLPAGDPSMDHEDDALPDAPHRASWTDSFPHTFHGWGPQTPDPADELGYTRHSDHRPKQDYGLHRHRNYAKEDEREEQLRDPEKVHLRLHSQELIWHEADADDPDHIVWRFRPWGPEH